MNPMRILRNELAKQTLEAIQKERDKSEEINNLYGNSLKDVKYPPPYLKGYYLATMPNVYVAFDNTDGYCWVEEFDTVEAALNWLEGSI